MTEPTYVFRKGEGWVPVAASATRVHVNHRERSFYLELRNPEMGEQYGVFEDYNKRYVQNKQLNLQAFKEYLEQSDSLSLNRYSVRHDELDPKSYYCTFVFYD